MLEIPFAFTAFTTDLDHTSAQVNLGAIYQDRQSGYFYRYVKNNGSTTLLAHQPVAYDNLNGLGYVAQPATANLHLFAGVCPASVQPAYSGWIMIQGYTQARVGVLTSTMLAFNSFAMGLSNGVFVMVAAQTTAGLSANSPVAPITIAKIPTANLDASTTSLYCYIRTGCVAPN